MKNKRMMYEEPRLESYEVMVEAGIAVSENYGWGTTGMPGDILDGDHYEDEL